MFRPERGAVLRVKSDHEVTIASSGHVQRPMTQKCPKLLRQPLFFPTVRVLTMDETAPQSAPRVPADRPWKLHGVSSRRRDVHSDAPTPSGTRLSI